MPPVRPLIPHSRPSIHAADLDGVADVLRSGRLAQGDSVRRFETAVARTLERRDGVATSAGTTALHLALLALGVGPGDEVIVPSYTCVAVLLAVHYVGAEARLAEIDPATYNLDPEDVRRCLNLRTRAIIVPHMFGLPADVTSLRELEIPIIEDCAQSFGARAGGRPAGSAGTLAVCSFYATKVLTTGEGGMVLADSDALLDRVRDLRDYDGRETLAVRFNYKMTEVEAALGLSQLRRLPEFLARRQRVAAAYTAALAGLPLRPPAVPAGRTHIFFRYVAHAADAAGLARRLRARGIECKPPVFRPLHRYLRMRGFRRTEAAMRSALSLPIYPTLSDEEIGAVVEAVGEAFRPAVPVAAGRSM